MEELRQPFTGIAIAIVIAVQVVEIQQRPSREMIEALGGAVGSKILAVPVVEYA